MRPFGTYSPPKKDHLIRYTRISRVPDLLTVILAIARKYNTPFIMMLNFHKMELAGEGPEDVR
jgi:hypothetical protein